MRNSKYGIIAGFLAILAGFSLALGLMVLRMGSVYVVSGDSMLPTFHNGSIIVVRKAKTMGPGQIVVFSQNGHNVVKRIAGVKGETMIFDGHVIRISDRTYPVPYTCHPKNSTVKLSGFVAFGDNAAVSNDSRYAFCHGENFEHNNDAIFGDVL